ncbi:unnamed protein product [Blepharisma stoltei]|uniref:Spermatogenesis-associated protein 17 n=1 Tax=Blepharisma stoltei TaxID=1481888 RepID=A0AAU9J2E8_9CILI|nr:unnamed protein product [Blepharisma stoltei]
MFNETQIRTPSPTFMLSHPNPASSKAWHGSSYSFSSTAVNFRSFSPEKDCHISLHRKNLDFQLTSIKKRLKKQKEALHSVQNSIKRKEEWTAIMIENLQKHNEQNLLYEKSAIIIQKHARRFLIKQKIDPIIMIKRQNDASYNLSDMKIHADVCLFHLGEKTENSAIKIQKAYRKHVIRKKLRIFQICFDLYCQDKKEQSLRFLRKSFRVIIAKLRVKSLIFEKFKKQKLKEIRENLAIFSIKSYWKHRKFTYKIMKDKISKYKQKKIAMQNKEMYQKFLLSLAKEKIKDPNSPTSPRRILGSDRYEEYDEESTINQDDLLNKDSEDVFKEARRIQALLEKKIKEKIALGKLSYSVKPLKVSDVKSKTKENQLRNIFERTFNKKRNNYRSSTASSNARGRILPREHTPKMRTTLMTPVPRLGHRHAGSEILPPIQTPPLMYTSYIYP